MFWGHILRKIINKLNCIEATVAETMKYYYFIFCKHRTTSRIVFTNGNTKKQEVCSKFARPVCDAATQPQKYISNRKQGVEHEHEA